MPDLPTVAAQTKQGGFWYACPACGLSRVSARTMLAHLGRTHGLRAADADLLLFQARRVAKVQGA